MPSADLSIRRALALRTAERGLARLKWLAAAARFELALLRHDRALKAGFNPSQPRVPRGNPDGGQWTEVSGRSSQREEGDDRPIVLAGDIPTGDPPEIPKERPKTSAERTAVLKRIARRLGPVISIAELAWMAGSWIYEYHAKIGLYRDPPKSLEELQGAVSEISKAGYQDHHIVEQTSAERDGKYSRELIDSRDNFVRIPTMRHEDINAWYQTPNKEYGRMAPREYLRDKSWDERRSVGLKALIEAKVLKP